MKILLSAISFALLLPSVAWAQDSICLGVTCPNSNSMDFSNLYDDGGFGNFMMSQYQSGGDDERIKCLSKCQKQYRANLQACRLTFGVEPSGGLRCGLQWDPANERMCGVPTQDSLGDYDPQAHNMCLAASKGQFGHCLGVTGYGECAKIPPGPQQ